MFIRLLRTILLLLAIGFFASFKILDLNAKNPHLLLQRIAPQLELLGINVMQDWNSKVAFDNRAPIIAPLLDYPAKRQDPKFKERWDKDLERGLVQGFAAVKYANEIPQKDFPTVWKKTRKEKRVFVSFTRADVDLANSFCKILEGQGYKPFTYIKDGVIGQSYTEVGEIMTMAGQHFVIDTRNARSSKGVIAEALFHSAYMAKFPTVELDPDGESRISADNLPVREKLIDIIVGAGLPISLKGADKLAYLDPSIKDAGSRLGRWNITLNGKLITDKAALIKWTKQISKHAADKSEFTPEKPPYASAFVPEKSFFALVEACEVRRARIQYKDNPEGLKEWWSKRHPIYVEHRDHSNYRPDKHGKSTKTEKAEDNRQIQPSQTEYIPEPRRPEVHEIHRPPIHH
jgi:hypothetical protein